MPWCQMLRDAGLSGKKSFLGDDYAKYTNIKVLLHSIGKNVVIELPVRGAKPRSFAIPQEEIYVE